MVQGPPGPGATSDSSSPYSTALVSAKSPPLEDVYRNGFVLGREANMLGTITFPGEIAEKQEQQ